jgi:hypothetical protein
MIVLAMLVALCLLLSSCGDDPAQTSDWFQTMLTIAVRDNVNAC